MALTTVRQVVGGLTRRVAPEVASRVPTADLDERDPDYIRNMLPGAWLVASLYFRAEVRGLEHVPAEGPVLIVGNHSGGNLTPDTTVFTLAFTSYFGAERCFDQLAHNVVMLVPWLSWLRKFGTVAASAENARRALRRGCALLVYPGGDMEVHRPTWEGGKVDFAVRSGPAPGDRGRRPVVPVVSVGGQEDSPVPDTWGPAGKAPSPRSDAPSARPARREPALGAQRRRLHRAPPAPGKDHHGGAAADRPAGPVRGAP